jgi:dUTP pyrophosphatase
MNPTTTVKFKKLCPGATIPQKKSQGAAAYDIYYPYDDPVTLFPTDLRIVSTGLAMEIPEGWKGEVYSRSGLASRGIFVANQPGKIDSDYRGEVKILLYNSSQNEITLVKGARIAQFELNPVYDFEWREVDELSVTERNYAGLGSTGVGLGNPPAVEEGYRSGKQRDMSF